MKNVIWVIGQLSLNLLVWFFTWLRWLGLLFGIGVALELLAVSGPGYTLTQSYLPLAALIYGVSVPLTFLFLVTFRYQHCCMDVGSLGRHLLHAWPKGYVEDALLAVMGPLGWFWIDRCLREWDLNLSLAIFDAGHYWCIDFWRQMRGKPCNTLYTSVHRH